jgi:hypothetical protein
MAESRARYVSSRGAACQARRAGVPPRCRFYATLGQSQSVCAASTVVRRHPRRHRHVVLPSSYLGFLLFASGKMVSVSVFWRVCLCLSWMWSIHTQNVNDRKR